MEDVEMSDFKIKTVWTKSDDNDAIFKNTTANLSISVAETFLTQNINGWTKSVQDSILVSTYPLAKWFAYYWWRHENEFLTINDKKPDFNWRIAHELGAANQGYVWPKVLFASDGEFINIWSDIIPTPHQSVNYIGKLDAVQYVPIVTFQKEVESLIEATVERITGLDEDLPELWKIVCEERRDPGTSNKRKLEAVLGYDPEECPEEILQRILPFQEDVGVSSIKEIAPFFGSDSRLQQRLQTEQGIESNPQVQQDQIKIDRTRDILPWQQGVSAARQLRKVCDLGDGVVENNTLLELLGIASNGLSDYNNYSVESPVSVGKNERNGKWTFIPREKRFETSQRFELARLLGDLLTYQDSNKEWLVTSDYKSSRQKAQRAFAGEFLCPIQALDDYLKGDYSETRREKAANDFHVSIQTIDTLLLNNGKIERDDKVFPYSA